MNYRTLYLAALALNLAFQAPAHAQAVSAPADLRFGPQLSFASQTSLGIGARVEAAFPRLYPGLFGIVAVDAFFPDCSGGDCGYLELNLGAAVPFVVEELLVEPYAGGGLNLVRADDSVRGGSGLGINLLGGAKIPVEGLQFTPFAELRLEFGGGKQFVISGGILF